MSREFKRDGLRYVITDGDEIDYLKYDNRDNILIALKNGAGFRGKLVRDIPRRITNHKRYVYAIERIEPEDLALDIKTVSDERQFYHPPQYNHREETDETSEKL